MHGPRPSVLLVTLIAPPCALSASFQPSLRALQGVSHRPTAQPHPPTAARRPSTALAMAHKPLDSGQPAGKGSSKSSARKRKAFVLPELLQAHLQSRQLISSMRLRPADACGAQSGRAAPASGGTAAPAAGRAAGGPASAPAACLVGGGRTYVPYRTLPLIFKQRRQHLQQQKSRARHTEPYQQRPGEGLLSLPEDVLVGGCSSCGLLCLLLGDLEGTQLAVVGLGLPLDRRRPPPAPFPDRTAADLPTAAG